ncbi:hypothetical protein BGX30_004686 [Mortierella sp. GBA39]|nr:hypothetical protein BGX30_004686 [Mortierella sp. GBA39]
MANDRNRMEEEEPEIIYIPDDEGNEEEFEVIMKFEVDGSDSKYMMVVPLDSEDDDSDEVYAFRYEEDGDDLKLYMIEDDEEWEIVEETFNTLAVWTSKLKEAFGPTVELEDEDGVTSVYDLTAEFEINGQSYAVLQKPGDQSGEFDILKVVSSPEGTLGLVTIDDDDEWENISELYDEMTFPEDSED